MAKTMTDIQRLAYDIYNNKVANFSKEEAENVIRKAVVDACGGEFNYYNFKKNQWDVFQIMSEVLTVASGYLSAEAYNSFVEFRDIALGDTIEFDIKDETLFRVANVATGTNDIRRQRMFSKRVPMTSFKLSIAIYEEWDMFVAGRVDFAYMVNKVAESFNHHIGQLIYKGVYESYNGLNSKLQESGSFDEEKLKAMVAKVEGKTGQKAIIMGTKTALAKIKYGAEWVSENLKDRVLAMGHVGNFYGTSMVELPQGLKPNSFEFAIDDDFLIVIPSGEKIVKFAWVGDAMVIENTDGTNRNDQQIEYKFLRPCAMAVIATDNYGIYRLS